MSQFTAECLDTFLRNQGQLFRENVAADREEAAEFLEECMAETVSSIAEVRKWRDESGMDVSGMSDEELAGQAEVFPLPDGSYLIVEG